MKKFTFLVVFVAVFCAALTQGQGHTITVTQDSTVIEGLTLDKGDNIVVRADYVVIRRNQITYPNIGITVYGSHCQIYGNRVERATAFGILVLGSHNVVHGNVLRHNAREGVCVGGNGFGFPDSTEVSHNKVIWSQVGIGVYGASNSYGSGNKITHCAYAILQGDGNNIEVADVFVAAQPNNVVSGVTADTLTNYAFTVTNKGNTVAPSTTYTVWIMPGRSDLGDRWYGTVPSLTPGEAVAITGKFEQRYYFTLTVDVSPVRGEVELENNKSSFSILFPVVSAFVENGVNGIPFTYELNQNYPNPFNPSTNITYSLAKQGNVNLTVYDITGNEVALLVNEVQPAGKHTIQFNGSKLASGVYFYSIKSGEFSEVKKMMLLK